MTLFKSGLLRLDEDPNADSEDVSQLRWDWVQRWMTECETRHEICSRAMRANRSAPWFPTRLIDARAKSESDGRIHYLLIETARVVPEGHRYVTLSHIWGSGPKDQQPAYRTVRDNYNARITTGIPRDELPACFQDAIDVTAKLGIPYLWVDSLCIIQKDDVDWAAEAGRMASVYSNSFLNLSATASSSSRDHFPSMIRAQREEEEDAQAPRLQEPRFVGTGWTGRFSGAYQIFDPHFWADRVTLTRLASRGWIFQERALAPRVLHFGFDQVLWECAESELAEEFPLEIPQRFIDSGRRGFKWQMSVNPLQDNAANAPNDDGGVSHAGGAIDQHLLLDSKWAKAIDNYSRCELTKSKDKLVAISGVARVLADRFNDEYVAGLWRSNIVGGLCWRVSQMRRTTQDLIPSGLYARRWEISRRFEEYRAPSWSWASVDGEITAGPFLSERRTAFRNKEGQEGYITMHSLVGTPDVDPKPVTDKNVFGEVNQMEMRLNGTLYRLGATAGEPLLDRQLSFHYIGSSEPAVVYLDQPEELQNVKEAYYLPLMSVECQFAVTDTAAGAATSSQLDVPVHTNAHEDITSHDIDRVRGIVVVQIEDGKTYQRVGFHECKASVLEALRDRFRESFLDSQLTII
jgi:hypothetical protein